MEMEMEKSLWGALRVEGTTVPFMADAGGPGGGCSFFIPAESVAYACHLTPRDAYQVSSPDNSHVTPNRTCGAPKQTPSR